MKYQVGDKVRFLNSKEKGTITKIIDFNKVVVDMDGGFEIPVLLNELVQDSFPIKSEKQEQPKIQTDKLENLETVNKEIHVVATKKDKLFVCFEALDSQNVTACDLIVSLANTTDYHLLFAYFSANEGDFTWKRNVEASADSCIELFRLKREKINECRELRFQIIFFKKEKFEMQSPLQVALKVKQDKLFIEKNFDSNEFVAGKAVVVELHCLRPPLTISEDELRKHFENSKIHVKDNYPVQKIKLQHTRIEEREIDLHIEELVDNISGMSNAQIVQIQLNYFMKNLDEAIALRLKKLIVIHGIGTGRLKAEVYKALQNYPKLKYQDASLAKYGFGATEILL